MQALTVPDGAIDTEQLADGAVETAKIADGAVTSSKLYPTMERVDATSITDLTLELQTIASTSINIDTDSRVWLISTCDCYTWDGALIVGKLVVDGNPLFHQIIAGAWSTGSHNAGLRYTASNNYVFELEPGNHTIELQARLVDSHGVGKAYRHSGFSYMVVGQ